MQLSDTEAAIGFCELFLIFQNMGAECIKSVSYNIMKNQNFILSRPFSFDVVPYIS